MKNNFDVINNTTYDIVHYKKMWEQVLQEVLKHLKIEKKVELTLNIVTPETIKKLNQTYRQKDYVADVLSFGFNEGEDDFLKKMELLILGDIFICWEKVLEQAKKYEHSINREAGFLFLHGLLHLLGYDHEIKQDETIMFGLQDEILTRLNILRK